MTGSPFFPAKPALRNAPRVDEELEDLNVRIPASLKFSAEREAQSAGVRMTYFVREALTRFIDEHLAERTMGLMPLPGRFDSDELLALEAAASRAGLSLTTWANHALLDRAAEPASADNIKKKAAA